MRRRLPQPLAQGIRARCFLRRRAVPVSFYKILKFSENPPWPPAYLKRKGNEPEVREKLLRRRRHHKVLPGSNAAQDLRASPGLFIRDRMLCLTGRNGFAIVIPGRDGPCPYTRYRRSTQ